MDVTNTNAAATVAAESTAPREFQNLEELRSGVTLIEASAGTGKTYTITALVLRLVVEENIPIDRILVVTFTEAATAELQARVRSRLRDALAELDQLPNVPSDEVMAELLVANGLVLGAPEEGQPVAPMSDKAQAFVTQARRRLSLAVTSFDQAAISTIHGFCQRTLRENAFESGLVFDTELVGDQTDLISEAVADFWVNRQHAGDRAFLRYIEKTQDNILGELTSLAHAAIGNSDMPILPEQVAAFDSVPFAEWEALYDGIKEMWRAERDAIGQVIASAVGAKRINGGTYRPDYMASRFRAAGAYFAGDAFQMAKIPDALQYFSKSKLQSATNAGKTTPTHAFFDQIDDLFDMWSAITGTFDDRLVSFKQDLVHFVRTELPRRKQHAQVQSFDDLLTLLDRALQGSAGEQLADAVRARYDVALIDEFQDTDPVQYRIFSRFFGTKTASGAPAGRLFLIGDPKQAIYAFRGADIFAYIDAAKAATTKRTLPTNYRSAPRLVHGVNHLFSRCPQPFGLSEIAFHPVKTPSSAKSTLRLRGREMKPLALYFRPAEVEGSTDYRGRQERFPSPADCTAAAIVTMLRWAPTFDKEREDEAGNPVQESTPVAPGDVAVLVRSNWEGGEVQRALQKVGVPCVVQHGSSVFQSLEAADLLLMLQALVEPNRVSALRAALTSSVLGLTGDDLFRMDEQPESWDSIVDIFREWRDLWRRRGFIHAYRAILSQRLRLRDPENPESPPAHLLRKSDGERRMTNLLHLAELLHEAETTERMSPAGLVRWLAARRVDGGDHEASQLRMESDAAAVKITTVHKSKGLEFPIVFCPYLSGPSNVRDAEKSRLRYHDENDDRRLKLSLDPDDDMLEQAEKESFTEAMRLLYVALTRAKERCVVIWDPTRKGAADSALAWLLFAQPDDSRAALADRLSALGPEGQFNELTELARASEGAISFKMLSPETGMRLDRSGEPDTRLEVRYTNRVLKPAWRISSYSGLVANAPERGPSEAGHDHAIDAVGEREPAGIGPRVTLADVPAGARFGSMIHEIYEHIDFQSPASADTQKEVADRLKRHGFHDPALAIPVGLSIEEAVSTPLDDSGLRLRDLTANDRLDELDFMFPVRAKSNVDPARIAAAFESHGGAHLTEVAEAIARLEFQPFEGFLKGFIDLTFVHGGRWYVVDYKSNDLGPTRDAYAVDKLHAAMLHGMYHLQYHLYCVAVHRYLKWRVPGWNYEKHFGGVRYLFLRGMHPDAGPNFGVYRDRPPFALVRALEAALDEGAR